MIEPSAPYSLPKLLLCEDSPTQREHTTIMLESNGYEVLAAVDGESALEKARDFLPDIVISDVVMPGIDGYELCRQLKADEELSAMPVMLLTSLSSPDDVVRGLECGADQFLTKPVDEEFLMSRLRAIEANRVLRKESGSNLGIDISLGEKRFQITSSRIQILDLLLSTYANAVQKARELEKVNVELRDALETISTMKELVPICCGCKKIRDDAGYWDGIEVFLTKHSIAKFSHSFCPECAETWAEENGLAD